MREKKHGKLEPGREGLNLANILRESLVCAVVVVDAKQRLSVLAGGTEEVLGLKQQKGNGKAWVCVQLLKRQSLRI